ncbi:MAG: aldehyde dehydrogenase family protein [Phycisphaerae bacterium]|nr:aldehyde dehydrogenase family protein [Phycisphaerae bacterium]
MSASNATSAETIESRNPARPQDVVWRGDATIEALESAVSKARTAQRAWSRAPESERVAALERWRDVTTARADEIARLITREMGKTIEESRAEAKLLGEKVSITLEASTRARVSSFTVSAAGGRRGECVFRPFGVMAVVGPFNFPAHLPNGHWVPALLLGNTVIFKPSDRTPAVGELLGRLARDAGFPDGVFQVVQGGPIVSSSLVSHGGIDGVLFTGSWPVGRRILEANLDRPGRIVALEMGGSNAAIVAEDAAPGTPLFKRAVEECVRSSFTTTGQRCTCTRRIVVHRRIAAPFTQAIVERAKGLLFGPGDAEPAPFMGPLVSRAARESVLRFVDERRRKRARVLLEPKAPDLDGWFISPGVIEVDRFDRESDEECFGPVVQVAAADSLDEMIDQANATDFGLVASVFTADDSAWEQCRSRVRVGCINRNCGTAGASSRLPFGGLGRSGNLRPAGTFSVDSCAFPQASLIDDAG